MPPPPTSPRHPLVLALLCVFLSLTLAGASPFPSSSSSSSSSLSSSSGQTEAISPHCATFRLHCEFNSTTASCVFRNSVLFRCGALSDVEVGSNATLPEVQMDCHWELTGDLVLDPGVRVAVEGDDCALKISIGKMLVLQPHSRLDAASLSVDASFVRLERKSSIVSQFGGTSYRGHDALFIGSDKVGGSYGGSGGMRLQLSEWTGPEQQFFGAFFDARQISSKSSAVAVRAAGAWDLEPLWASVIEDPNDNEHALLLMGSGSKDTSGNIRVPSGGRIRVAASRDLVMMPESAIVASGADATSTAAAGGSGGSIFLSAAALSLTESSVEARGGDAFCKAKLRGVSDCVPAGGGGRVHIAYVSSQLEDDAVDVRGGSLGHSVEEENDDGENDDNSDTVSKILHPLERRSLNGATGTYLRVFHAATTGGTTAMATGSSTHSEAMMLLTSRRSRVIPTLDDDTDPTKLIDGGAVTPLIVDAHDRHLNTLVVRDSAIVATQALRLGEYGDIKVQNGSFLIDDSLCSTGISDSDSLPALKIHARTFLVADDAHVRLNARSASVNASTVTTDSSTTMRFSRSMTLSSVHNLRSEAAIQSSPLSTSDDLRDGTLALMSGNDVLLGGSVVVASLAVHADASIRVDSALIDASRAASIDDRFSPCSSKSLYMIPSAEALVADALASNFTIYFRAAESIEIGVPPLPKLPASVVPANNSLLFASTAPVVVTLTGSAVSLCAQDEIMLGDGAMVASNGRGEQSNQGPGSGDCVGSVGGGGGYGGRGADSSAVNELGDYASGGLAYGTRSGIGMLGSGGGCVDGGAGGGVVMIGARGVVLNGQVHCNGDGGVNSAGGGSGGFLGLTIAEYLSGHGQISAVGGGAKCIDLENREQQPQAPGDGELDNTTAFATAVDQVAAIADSADAADATAIAKVSITRVCGGGGGGGRLQLHGCEQNNIDHCTSGFDGNYTVAGGSTSFRRPDGSSELPSTGSAQGSKLKRAASGSFVGFPCPPGSGGLFCRLCAPGTFKAESNSEECQPCSNAPSNSHYIGYGATTSECDWTCDPGYSGDFCVSPIEQLLDACGGVIGFGVVLLSIVVFLILLGYSCRARKEPSYTRNVPRGRLGHRGHSRGSGGMSGSMGGAGSQGERQHLLSAAIASTQRSRFAFLLRWLYWPRIGYPKLVERDLHEHMARVYFSGLNDRDSPLKLRLTVPLPLKSVLYEDEFRLLAERINAALAWPTSWFGSWGEICYRLVVLLCYPASSAVLEYRRHLRLNALKRIIARYNHACMKGPRARGLLNALKLGYSGDYSLVYLELLYKESSQSACVPTTKIGKPSLPIALLFAGRGTYESPFFLDPSDLLVRSIPQCPELTAFIDEPWIEFVAELNELLRVVSRNEVAMVETLLPVAKFLEKKMASAVASGSGKLGGLRIYLGRFYVGDGMDCGEEFKLGILVTTVAEENAANNNDTALTKPPQPPLSSGASSRYAYGTYNPVSAYDSYGRSSSHPSDQVLMYDPVTGGWSYAPAPMPSSSSSRGFARRGSIGNAPNNSANSTNASSNGPPSHKSTVSSIREEALRIRSNTSGSVDNLIANGNRVSDFDSPEVLFGQPSSKRSMNNRGLRRRRRQTFYEGWLGPVDASLPVPGVLISADELEDRLVDQTKQQRIESFLRRHLLPTNVPRSKFLLASWMVHGALLALLMVDLAITFAMVVNLRCVTDGEVDKECSATILMPVLLLPPLTLFLAPIMGIVSLAIASNSFSRRYSIWNALSMVNVAVAILACITQSSRLVAPWFTAPLPLLPVIAMLIKGGEAYVIERYIAFQETNRRRRGWRGLMKRRLSEASIPPESPYSSPVSSDSTPSYLTGSTATTAFR